MVNAYLGSITIEAWHRNITYYSLLQIHRGSHKICYTYSKKIDGPDPLLRISRVSTLLKLGSDTGTTVAYANKHIKRLAAKNMNRRVHGHYITVHNLQLYRFQSVRHRTKTREITFHLGKRQQRQPKTSKGLVRNPKHKTYLPRLW